MPSKLKPIYDTINTEQVLLERLADQSEAIANKASKPLTQPRALTTASDRPSRFALIANLVRQHAASRDIENDNDTLPNPILTGNQ